MRYEDPPALDRAAVAAALADPDRYVRGQAEATADDIAHFTGERITH